MVLVAIDRATVSLVWSNTGYPADGPYRDYHHHTIHHHNPWPNEGDAYNHELAKARARAHAQTSWLARVSAWSAMARACREAAGVCALDTELLGHWWYEGLVWLAAVVEECARQGLALVRLDDAAGAPSRRPQLQARDPPAEGTASSWGAAGDLSTWSGPAVAELAFATRAAELAPCRRRPRSRRACASCWRSPSDWAFMVSRGLAVPYARERFDATAVARAGARGRRGRRSRRAGVFWRCMPIPCRAAGLLISLPAQRLRRLAHGGSRALGRQKRSRWREPRSATTALVPITLSSPTVTPRRTHAP